MLTNIVASCGEFSLSVWSVQPSQAHLNVPSLPTPGLEAANDFVENSQTEGRAVGGGKRRKMFCKLWILQHRKRGVFKETSKFFLKKNILDRHTSTSD